MSLLLLLYSKVNNLEQEGIKTRVPYAEKLQTIFQDLENMESLMEVELYVFCIFFMLTVCLRD
jgi:hypothetical protein